MTDSEGRTGPATAGNARLAEPDHLVLAASSLDAGAAWCEATFGVAPAPGGRHAFMGTHNRLLAIGSAAHPGTYLEIIAVDPDAPPPGRARWFGLDDPAVRRAVASGPRLVHWVARTLPGVPLATARGVLLDAGHDPGEPTTAGRETPRGWLRWTITLGPVAAVERPPVPHLIAWDAGSIHPAQSLAPCGVALERVAMGGPAAALAARLGVERGTGPAPVTATFSSPRGTVTLDGL